MALELKSASFMIRMRPSVKAAAEKAAEADGRSLAAYIERLLEERLRDDGFLPKLRK
jgi:predicted HicB family RNase H-like nuclease